MESSCDVTSPSRLTEDSPDRNRNYESRDDSNDSHEQQGMMGRDLGSELSHSMSNVHQPFGNTSSLLQRRLSVRSNSSAFDVINPLTKLPMSSRTVSIHSQSPVLSKCFPSYSSKNGMVSNRYLQTLPTDLSVRSSTTASLWTYADILHAKHGAYAFSSERTSSSSSRADENISFDQYFMQFAKNLARARVAESAPRNESLSPKTRQNSHGTTSEMDAVSESMPVDKEEEEEEEKEMKESSSSSPLNLKTDRSRDEERSLGERKDDETDSACESAPATTTTAADNQTDTNHEDFDPLPPPAPAAAMTSPSPMTSPLTSSSLTFLQQLGQAAAAAASVGLFAGLHQPPHHQHQHQQSSSLLSSSPLYPHLPGSPYPAMTSLGGRPAVSSPRLLSLFSHHPLHPEPHPNLMSMLQGSPGVPALSRGSQPQPRVSGGVVPHSLGFYPPPGFGGAGGAGGGGGGGGGRRGSVDKPPALKKYKCDVCDKAFSRSNTLVTHKRIHTGDKPFSCEQCGRAFRQPGNLTRHRLTHTTHKPYICVHCSKAFNRASNLNTHMRIHSIRSFNCHFCQRHFPTKNDLRHHMYSHGDQTPALTAMLRQ